MAESGKLKLALIGCGAVSRIFYLPAIGESGQIELVALVDKHLPNARQNADKYNVPLVCKDFREIIGKVDAAVVALPNYLHEPVSVELMENGVHVLVEKPMALTAYECDMMINAAGKAGVVLAVGLGFRFFHYARFVKQLLDSGFLGEIEDFELRQGVILTWSASSDYMLRKETAGGGVLADFGPHMLDLLLWWLGDYERVEYHDDAAGGVEANCEIRIMMKRGASGFVEMSRMRNLSNTCTIRGIRGTLEVGIWDSNPTLRLSTKDGEMSLEGRVTREGIPDNVFRNAFRRELDDFANAVRNGSEPFVPGREGRRSVELIETCYSVKRLMVQEWDRCRVEVR